MVVVTGHVNVYCGARDNHTWCLRKRPFTLFLHRSTDMGYDKLIRTLSTPSDSGRLNELRCERDGATVNGSGTCGKATTATARPRMVSRIIDNIGFHGAVSLLPANSY